MLVPSAGRRRLPAAIAAASVCAVTLLVHVRDVAQPAPAVRAAVAPRSGAALDDAGYVAVAAHLQSRLDRRWNSRLERYDPGPGATTSMVNGDLLLVHAVAAATRPSAAPLRADARARAIVRLLTGPQVWAERPLAGADPQVIGPGLGGGARSRVPPPGLRQLEVVDGLVHAYLARDALGLDAGHGGPHPRARSTRSRRARLPLARPAAQPDQLVLRAVRRRRDRQRRARGARRRHGAPARRFLAACAARAARPATSGPGLRFHYLPHRARGREDERGLGRVREHRPELLALLRARPHGRHARARAARPAPRVGAARAQRLLDAQRLHELGQRPRLRALAPAQEDGARAARADRRRRRSPSSSPGPEWGAWAKWMLDRGLLAYDDARRA